MENILYICFNKQTGELLYSGTDVEKAEQVDIENNGDIHYFCFSLEHYHTSDLIRNNDFSFLLNGLPKSKYLKKTIVKELLRFTEYEQYTPFEDVPI